MTEAEVQQLRAFWGRVGDESHASRTRSRRAWSAAKRIMLIALLVAFLSIYHLLSQLHAALVN
jgi:hypothetical protein